jgi:hypothetical protein
MSASIVHCYELPSKGYALGVVAKRVYAVSQGKRAVPRQERPAIQIEPQYVASTTAPDLERLVADTDLCAVVALPSS